MPEPSACERACLRAGKSHKGPIYVAGSSQCFQTRPSHVFITATPPPLASCQQRGAFHRCPPLASPRARGPGWPRSAPGQRWASAGRGRCGACCAAQGWHAARLRSAMLQPPSPLSTQGCSRRGGAWAGGERRSPSPTLLRVPVWSARARCPSGSPVPPGAAVSSGHGLAAGAPVPRGSRQHRALAASPEPVCEGGIVPAPERARTLGTEGLRCLAAVRPGRRTCQHLCPGTPLHRVSHRLEFAGGQRRARGCVSRPAGGTAAPELRPGNAPYGRSGRGSCAAHRPCTGVDMSCPICPQPCRPPPCQAPPGDGTAAPAVAALQRWQRHAWRAAWEAGGRQRREEGDLPPSARMCGREAGGGCPG